ncbi:uncharacterized protein LOC116438512 isoform X2 [Corvus moneduloides]|uniref:uncharacterized protein LOC116438512 isoform X2 n=1 Tax=Corvus moneduloides TaxID=1196302 RepID=UPI0013640BAD|nr:uncharacterized protein LOC116438512 isoform X2 [Corvus moneduloides]
MPGARLDTSRFGFKRSLLERRGSKIGAISIGKRKGFRLQLLTPLLLRNSEWHAAPVSTGGELGAGDQSPDSLETTEMDPAPSIRAVARSLQLVVILQLLPWPASPWIVPQRAANVWSVLAQTMGQDHICLHQGRRTSTDKMQAMVMQIRKETGDWLGDIFSKWGLSGWAGSIFRPGLIFLFVLLVALILFRLLKRMLVKLITSSPSPTDIDRAEVLPDAETLQEPELEPMAPELQEFEVFYPDSEYYPQPNFKPS